MSEDINFLCERKHHTVGKNHCTCNAQASDFIQFILLEQCNSSGAVQSKVITCKKNKKIKIKKK